MMTQRERLYRQFGARLIEAVTRLTLAQINILRAQAGLSTFTFEQFADALETELNNIVPYPWEHS